MLHVPLRMPFCAYELLALRQHLLRAFCESVLSHHWSFTSISLVCDREHGASNSRCLHPGLFPMFPVPGSWLLIVYRRQHPVSVRLQLRPQALHFLFHLTDALVHADDNFDPGEVHPQVLDQPLDVPQSRHIRMRIQSLPSVRPARLDKADALVVAQALGMQTHQPRRYADNVARLLILSLVIVLHLYITASNRGQSPTVLRFPFANCHSLIASTTWLLALPIIPAPPSSVPAATPAGTSRRSRPQTPSSAAR